MACPQPSCQPAPAGNRPTQPPGQSKRVELSGATQHWPGRRNLHGKQPIPASLLAARMMPDDYQRECALVHASCNSFKCADDQASHQHMWRPQAPAASAPPERAAWPAKHEASRCRVSRRREGTPALSAQAIAGFGDAGKQAALAARWPAWPPCLSRLDQSCDRTALPVLPDAVSAHNRKKQPTTVAAIPA